MVFNQRERIAGLYENVFFLLCVLFAKLLRLMTQILILVMILNPAARKLMLQTEVSKKNSQFEL